MKRKIEEYVQDSKLKEKSLMQFQHQIEIITQERINRQRHFHVKISHLINQSVDTFLVQCALPYQNFLNAIYTNTHFIWKCL